MFNLAVDSKLRGCDVVHLKVEDVAGPLHSIVCHAARATSVAAVVIILMGAFSTDNLCHVLGPGR